MDDDEIEKVLVEVKVFTQVSHFFWGLWGILNYFNDNSIDFSYDGYALSRFDAFKIMKA